MNLVTLLGQNLIRKTDDLAFYLEKSYKLGSATKVRFFMFSNIIVRFFMCISVGDGCQRIAFYALMSYFLPGKVALNSGCSSSLLTLPVCCCKGSGLQCWRVAVN